MPTLDAKDPDTDAQYAIDWYDQLVLIAEREAAYDEGEIVQFDPDSGWVYECTTPGRTGSRSPRTPPRADGLTLVDGSVVWTCRHPSDVTVPVVGSAEWNVPDGISLVNQSELGAVTSVLLTGGTDGEDYDITCRMTPTIGEALEQTITIPVRSL